MTGSSDRWSLLGRVLALGAAFDAAFAVAILAFTRPAAALLRLPVPADPVYLYLNGVLLLLLAGVYAVAAREPERYQVIAPVSAAGRALGCGLFAWAWIDGRPATFLVLGLTDLAFGAATAAVWLRARARSHLTY